jgi:hypothetical protein
MKQIVIRTIIASAALIINDTNEDGIQRKKKKRKRCDPTDDKFSYMIQRNSKCKGEISHG